MKSFFVAVLVVLLFIIALLFGARNDQVVTISYFIAQGEFRLPVVLAVVFITGFLISWLLTGFYLIQMNIKLRLANKKTQLLKQQLSANKTEIEIKS